MKPNTPALCTAAVMGWLLVFSLALPLEAAAQRGLLVTPGRTALIIGNGAYPTSPLKNPVHDAEDMARLLEKLGFTVVLRLNADLRNMESAVRDFGRQLNAGGTGVFYYAGHGMQVEGRNYLIPVGARIESESDVRFEALDVGRVLGKMEDAGNGLNIVILDACRDNPFARAFRSVPSGLARMDAPRGTLIAYATAPGSVAADGTGRNGIYTQNLLAHMATPGLPVEEVFKRVRNGVIRDTAEKQVPWESSSLTGSFYFAAPAPAAAAEAGPETAGGAAADATQAKSDLLFWESVKDTNDPALYQAYLKQFPQGVFTEIAGFKLRALQQSAAPAAPHMAAAPASAVGEKARMPGGAAAHESGQKEQAPKAAGDAPAMLASVPPVDDAPVLQLRAKPGQVDSSALGLLLKRYGFFEKDRNQSGNYRGVFAEVGQDLVLDRRTRLMWQKGRSQWKLPLGGAHGYVADLNATRFGGYDDWRLPTVEELASLLTSRQSNGAYIDGLFGPSDTTFWSADTAEETHYRKVYWVISFYSGNILTTYWSNQPSFSTLDKNKENYVRAVRTPSE
jgi:uncharacterized caspase-like protein